MRIRRRPLTLAAAVVVLLHLLGALYQTVSVRREDGRFPAPGRLIAVEGGRRLHLVCVGEGEPTVVFEPSGFGGALSSRQAREEIGAHTRACSYDRMGMGWSDPGPAWITAGQLADDLERLIVQAGLRAPVILVPASVGGLTAEMFARRHPDQVAGLVSVDAGNSGILERFAGQLNWVEIESVCLVKAAARFGVLRLLDPFRLGENKRLYRVEAMTTICGVVRGFQASAQEMSSAPPLRTDLPLTVLVHEKPYGLLPPGLSGWAQTLERDWLGLQQGFAQRSRRGTWRVVPGSIHLIGESQPHAVASAVLEMVAEVRHEGRP